MKDLGEHPNREISPRTLHNMKLARAVKFGEGRNCEWFFNSHTGFWYWAIVSTIEFCPYYERVKGEYVPAFIRRWYWLRFGLGKVTYIPQI